MIQGWAAATRAEPGAGNTLQEKQLQSRELNCENN